MTDQLCTCGKRPKHKCCEENEYSSGKMCLKDYEVVRIPDELLERIRILREKAEKNKLKDLSVEDTFDIMFGRYQYALKELSEK